MIAHIWSVIIIFSLPSTLAVVSNSSNQFLDMRIQLPGDGNIVELNSSTKDKCLEQLHFSLEKLRKRQTASTAASLIDLSGYALHQSLRNAPVDMYVTDIKVRAPTVGSWVQVQRCQFSRHAEMRTQLLFNDLLISGIVRLLPSSGDPQPAPQPSHGEFCTMTLRLRRAGLDLKATPDLTGGAKNLGQGRGLQLRTESNFVDPHFLSVHAYGCRLDKWARDNLLDPSYAKTQYRSLDTDDNPQLRIISLRNDPDMENSDDNDSIKQRILTFSTPSEKLAAVISVQKQIQLQANQLFQTHGPFSQISTVPPPLMKPLFTSLHDLQRPQSASITSEITELDDQLRPIGSVKQPPFASLVSATSMKPPINANYAGSPLHDVSSEMEDVFLRGAKALLAKYLEKQLEIPMKEALLTKIGYTVSYG